MQSRWNMPFPQYGCGNSYGLTRPYGIFDQYPFGGYFIEPRQIVYNVYEQCKPSYECRKLSKRGGRYYITERNGREVVIGEMNISNALVVNPREDGSFNCIYCEFKGEGMLEKRACQFPFEAIRKHNPLPYISDFHRNPDCPPEYIIAAFFEELFTNNELKFLNLPSHSGWNLLEGSWAFVSAESMIPQLAEYYAADIPLRQMPQTDRTLQQAVDELAVLLPDNNAYRTLINANVSSCLLGFYEIQQLKPDRMFVVSVESEQNAKLATVLLQNRGFTDTYICSLLECSTVLNNELRAIWDGNVIFRDSSYVENKKRRDSGLEVLLQNLRRGQGINEVNRKIIATITDRASAYSSELPAVYVEMTGCPAVENLEKLQQAIGTFLVALIRTLVNTDATENLVTAAIKHTPMPQKTIENDGEIGTEAIMRCTATLLSELGLFDRTHMPQLDELFRSGADAVCEQDLAIVNEFRSVLSSMIDKGELRVANQFSSPYYSAPDEMIMLDREHDCANFSSEVLNKLVHRLKSTQRKKILLHALTACGKLRANNNNKRLLDVEIAPGVVKSLYFYSVPRTMLTPSCRVKLNEVRFADYFVPRSDFQEDFVPIVKGENGFAAGRVINDETDEAESIYASGKTRSGKTYFLVQQAVIRAAAGHRVIAFDQTGAFSQDELRKHLPDELVDAYFSQWEIGEQGLPVNPLSLENCKSLPDKKQRIANVLSVLARLTGDVQLKVLRSRLAKIVRAIEAGKIHSLADTRRFFDMKDPDQAEILERLEEAFEDLEGLPNSSLNWGDFLETQGKIVVISTASDGIRKSTQFIDALLASLYAWKQYNRTSRMTVVLDEIEDLCLEHDGPIDTILRKGGKHRLFMILASQAYSTGKNRLAKLIGNCGLQLIFQPKDDCIDEITKKHGIDRLQFAALEQGECFAIGGFLNKQHGKNKQTAICGKAYSATTFLNSDDQETQGGADTPSELSEEPLLEGAANLNDDTISEAEALSSVQLFSHDLDETERAEIPLEAQELETTQSPETVDDVPEAASLKTVESSAQESIVDESEEKIPEAEEPPTQPDSEPDENPQEIIERELQQRFRDLISRFDPDYPSWVSCLDDLFAQIMEKHHFSCPADRENMKKRLERFMHLSPDCSGYEKYLDSLFKGLWP